MKKNKMMNSYDTIDTINESVYDWWMRSYKSDEEHKCFNEDINYFDNDVGNKTITFKEVLDGMIKGKCVYEMCDIGDSEVRCAIFRRMCDLFDIDYEVIYNLWLGGIDKVAKKVIYWEKYAKYRGKNPAKFYKKISKEIHLGFADESIGIDERKKTFAKWVSDYEKLKKVA